MTWSDTGLRVVDAFVLGVGVLTGVFLFLIIVWIIILFLGSISR